MIPGGLSGIKSTLHYMRQFSNEYKTHQIIRELALELTANIPQKDFPAELQTLFDFVKFSIRYVRDVNDVETVQSPLKTLEYSAGDCDDKATLLASLAESIGFKTRFHALGFSKNNVEHVVLEVFNNGKWLPMDTTEPQKMGWIPPNIKTSLYG